MWLKNFKIAIIQKEIETIDRLLGEMPAFEHLEELQEAASLTKEALCLMHSLQDENEKVMQQLQKNIKFLKSTHTDAPQKLDLKS